MKQEYTRDTYPSYGKKYNGEKGIISLTSWKARINTVSKTIFSLIKQCPGFHIVLCLSEEEFPLMEKELPENLMLFADNNLIEILWVYKNYKAFKKVLFTMDKYRDVPIISADDDCIYTCNYAEKLYRKWEENKECIISNDGRKRFNISWGRGPNTLFPPNMFHFDKKEVCSKLFKNDCFLDEDMFYGAFAFIHNIKIIDLFKYTKKSFYVFHDEIDPYSKEHKMATKKDADFCLNFIKENDL